MSGFLLPVRLAFCGATGVHLVDASGHELGEVTWQGEEPTKREVGDYLVDTINAAASKPASPPATLPAGDDHAAGGASLTEREAHTDLVLAACLLLDRHDAEGAAHARMRLRAAIQRSVLALDGAGPQPAPPILVRCTPVERSSPAEVLPGHDGRFSDLEVAR